MKTQGTVVGIILVLGLTQGAGAAEPMFTDNARNIIYSGENLSNAEGDTVLLMGPSGSGAANNGDFELVGKALVSASGWTSVDYTQPTESHWSRSERPITEVWEGNEISAWCGADLAACAVTDSIGGYGNTWHELLTWTGTATDPLQSATLTVTWKMYIDSEPGYDFTYLSYQTNADAPGTYTDQASWSGTGVYTCFETILYDPDEYIGTGGVALYFRFQSDATYSDEDCSFFGAGGSLIDDVTVTLSQSGQTDQTTFDDFESGWGNWTIAFPAGYGDFAHLWTGLADLDPCTGNPSTQVVFVDDGLVVPGTGGSHCTEAQETLNPETCYGPGGYVLNVDGGLSGPGTKLHNGIESPVMNWPDSAKDGISLDFDVWRHEMLHFSYPAVVYRWDVRSGNDGDLPIAVQPWRNHGFAYYGEPEYIRHHHDLADLVLPGRTQVQVRLVVQDWDPDGWCGIDATPAPYFDNVRVTVYPTEGPAMTTSERDLANDGFPACGNFDPNEGLGRHSVRFDMACNISPADDERNDPGDSIVVRVVPRTGGALDGVPTLHWSLSQNPLFDSSRTSSATSGFEPGMLAADSGLVADTAIWAFDLPDTGFLFPGDILHYYIKASDIVDGGPAQTSTLPADLTGFGDFSHPLKYDSSFVVHALPTIRKDGSGGYEQPPILFWNDFADRGGQASWYSAFDNLGLSAGEDYDIFYTNAPELGLGNGLGGRATTALLAEYSEILYTCGDLYVNTISNGDYLFDAGDDTGLMMSWLDLGERDIFLTGDSLASDLAESGTGTMNFLNVYMGLDFLDRDIRPLLSDPNKLKVKAASSDLSIGDRIWLLNHGCPSMNMFDAVEVRGGAGRWAQFLDPSGNPGAFAYSAATVNPVAVAEEEPSRVVSLPYDFMFIRNDPEAAKAAAPVATRVDILRDVLAVFGIQGLPASPAGVSDVPQSWRFAAWNHPNPFNPMTRISYTMPRKTRLTLKIFDVRGYLVRTLIDEVLAAGPGHVTWDGTDQAGRTTASGIYFYEARTEGEVIVRKMAMIR